MCAPPNQMRKRGVMANRKVTKKTPEPHVHARVVSASLNELAAAISRHIVLPRQASVEQADKPETESNGRERRELRRPETMAASPGQQPCTTIELASQIDCIASKLAARLTEFENKLRGSSQPTANACASGVNGTNELLQSEIDTLSECHNILSRIAVYTGLEC